MRYLLIPHGGGAFYLYDQSYPYPVYRIFGDLGENGIHHFSRIGKLDPICTKNEECTWIYIETDAATCSKRARYDLPFRNILGQKV